MNTIADITILVLGVLFIAAYVMADMQYARANRLQAENDRLHALHVQYLISVDEMMVSNAEIERYNAWLENQIVHLGRTGQRSSEIASMMMHRRAEWQRN